MVRVRSLACLMMLLSISAASLATEEQSVVPKDGFVPNAETAARIAEAVLIPIYGQDKIARERPLVAELRGDVWYVTGSLPAGYRGGVAEVRIQKQDGRIVFLAHGR
jgi:NTF2 fold immunity protein of polymorphic toxin system component